MISLQKLYCISNKKRNWKKLKKFGKCPKIKKSENKVIKLGRKLENIVVQKRLSYECSEF